MDSAQSGSVVRRLCFRNSSLRHQKTVVPAHCEPDGTKARTGGFLEPLPAPSTGIPGKPASQSATECREGPRGGLGIQASPRKTCNPCPPCGGFSSSPENSMEAIRSAYLAGSDGIECDLRLAADGKVAVLHDEDLNRLTHQDVKTSQITLDALLRLRLRDSFYLNRLSSQPPLTLRILLEEFGGKFLLWLELKPIGGRELATQVGEMLRKYKLADSAIVSSLSPAMIQPLRKRFRNLRIAFEFIRIGDKQIRFVENLMEAADKDRIIVSCEEFQAHKPPILKKLQEKLILTSTFTPNRFDALSHSIRLGINLIQTDRPDRARLLLCERGGN